MNILIVVHGRFHAFDLANALSQGGHEVTVFTGLPPSRYEPFGLARDQTKTFWLYGALEKLTRNLPERLRQSVERKLKKAFSRWALHQYHKLPETPDAIYCFSGVALELFTEINEQSSKLLARGSAHILEQKDILTDAFQRHLGRTPQAGPESFAHDWMISREQLEYELSDAVVVQSTFALESFRERGIEKCYLMQSASDNALFSVDPKVLTRRVERIRGGEPLRILTVGEFSVRKGAFELAAIAENLKNENMTFRFVGDVSGNCQDLRANTPWINFYPRVSHFELSSQYDWADVFLFPTLEDGFAAVVAQAYAQGLPMLASRNCGAFDMMKSPRDGQITSAGDIDSMTTQLKLWCDDRESLAQIAEGAKHRKPLAWEDTATQLTNIIRRMKSS